MTITLGGFTISDNMYLGGLQSAPGIASTQTRTILGTSVLTVNPLIGGRNLKLGTVNKGGATMGIWCSSDIDQVKMLEQQGDALVLDYKGAIYNVVITGATFTPMFANEVEGPNKKFTGEIYLTEV